MTKIDSILLTILSDLLVNLSAGWFGIAIIDPFLSKRKKFRFVILTMAISLGILSLVIAYVLKKLV